MSWVRLPGAESCSGPRAVAAAVERRLGREVFVSPARAAIAIEGRVESTAAPRGFRAVLVVSDESGAALGTRELRSAGPSCAAMDEELALVIAVMIDPDAALASLPGEPRRPPPPPPPQAPPPVVIERVAPPVAPPRRPWHASVQLGGIFALGLVPGPGGGAVLRSRIEPPRGPSFELGGVLFAPSDAARSGLGATFQLAEAFLSACPLEARAFGGVLSACAGVQLGALRAGGFGFALAHDAERAVFNAALEGRVRRRAVGPLVIGAGLGLLVPIVRDRFFYRDAAGASREVFRMSPIAGAVDLSVGVEFP